jgi:hypothetical protein
MMHRIIKTRDITKKNSPDPKKAIWGSLRISKILKYIIEQILIINKIIFPNYKFSNL